MISPLREIEVVSRVRHSKVEDLIGNIKNISY